MTGILRPMLLALVFTAMITNGCSGPARQDQPAQRAVETPTERVQAPSFNMDSAYFYVERQVAFGPRVPNTRAHEDCGDWLEDNLGRFADTVYVQHARVRAFDGTLLNIRNIIGVFQPEQRRRILLCAHWDSRPFADHDPDPANHYTPIDGANDGASGVGVLMEIARQLQQHQPGVGIDIIFFDAEDYGKHQQHPGRDEDSWALGSQHWARNPHQADYMAAYGILLDMVGAAGATFKHEGFSMMFAPDIVRKVWNTARQAGFGHYFLEERGGYVTDDHYYINTIRNIPTINIIHQEPGTPHGFFPQWHTVDDTMEHIDPFTLHAVGQTVLHVIFENP
jgi:hypothetical protein